MRLGLILTRVRLEKDGTPIPDAAGGFDVPPVALDPPEWKFSIEPAAGANIERTVGGTVEGAAIYMLTGKPHPQMTIKARAIVIHGEYEGHVFEVHSVQKTTAVPVQHVLMCSEVIRS